MRSWLKVVTTVWTMLLASPLLWGLFGYSRLTCGEYDKCSTGEPLPGSTFAAALFVALLASQVGFLLALWRYDRPRRKQSDK